MLLRELNNLREELKIIRDRNEDYEIARQTAEARGIHSIDALIQTLNADAGLTLFCLFLIHHRLCCFYKIHFYLFFF